MLYVVFVIDLPIVPCLLFAKVLSGCKPLDSCEHCGLVAGGEKLVPQSVPRIQLLVCIYVLEYQLHASAAKTMESLDQA